MLRNQTSEISKLTLLSPLVLICHFLEEAPGFVQWFNEHVNRDITLESFWTVTLAGLVVTVGLLVFNMLSDTNVSLSILIAWLSFLMPANAIIHIASAFLDGSYVPGLVSAVVLYLPYYFWLVVRIVRVGRLSREVLFSVAVIGSIPMLIHGYLILFRSDRLF